MSDVTTIVSKGAITTIVGKTVRDAERADVVELLAGLLNRAQAGEIDAVAVVVLAPFGPVHEMHVSETARSLELEGLVARLGRFIERSGA